jgi:hypothetical protein
MTDKITIALTVEEARLCENALCAARAGLHVLTSNLLPGLDSFAIVEDTSDRLCGIIQQIKREAGI